MEGKVQMGESRKQDDLFGNGFSIHKENGETEQFPKNIICGGYSGDKGTHVAEHLLYESSILGPNQKALKIEPFSDLVHLFCIFS